MCVVEENTEKVQSALGVSHKTYLSHIKCVNVCVCDVQQIYHRNRYSFLYYMALYDRNSVHFVWIVIHHTHIIDYIA